ncbi:MAG: hypothetical protein ACYC61_07190 [Isosphaeraceae bacterium]
MQVEKVRREAPLSLALLFTATILGGLLVGFEPVGGDPDRMYRPLKSELARALGEGHLPEWSDRFGTGLPLLAESHVAAYYPPNLVLYRILDVSTAYRLLMWGHYLALTAATYFYARCLGVLPWGAALSALAFTFCGFQAIHSSHEPFYCLLPYLPLALGLAERFMMSGRPLWLVLLPPVLGVQWTLGHFQIQTWTGGLVIVTGLWRAAVDRRPWGRAGLLVLAVGAGIALAAVQLGPSWQFSDLVGQTRRAASELLFYSYPPAHWFEPVLPRPVRELRQGPEDPYWFGEQTTGFEAALYVGTIPLILAFVAIVSRPTGRATLLWRLAVPIAFAMATMPRWWPRGYLALLAVPGLGYFRVPARYTLLASLGLCLLAGEGLDRSISRGRFRVGIAAALAFAASATAAAVLWSMRGGVHLRPGFAGIPNGFLWAALAWSSALVVVGIWRSGRTGCWMPLGAVAIELGILYYAGTTQWGWSIAIPGESPVLTELTRAKSVGPVGGQLANLPVRAGLATASPYTGFAHPDPNRIIVLMQERLFQAAIFRSPGSFEAGMLTRWLRRCRVTHLVADGLKASSLGTELGQWRDPALDRIVYHAANEREERLWSIVRLADPFPEARVTPRARTAPDRAALVEYLARSDDLETAWFLTGDGVPARPDSTRARLTSWNGFVATVEHDGPCDLVLARTYDPGWLARIDDGPERPVLRADVGFLAVRLEGSGTHRVRLFYRTPRAALWWSITFCAAALEVLATLELVWRAVRRRGRPAGGEGPGATWNPAW